MTQQALAENPTPTLREQTEEAKNAFVAQLPDEDRQTLMSAFGRLLSSDVADQAKQVGDAAPDFELPDAHGGTLRLSDVLSLGPVVLSFYRGGWCPFCNLEFKALHDHWPAMRRLGATLVAVSPETPEHTRKTARDFDLDFPVLSDRGNLVTRDYGLLMTVYEEIRPLYLDWGIDLPQSNGDQSHQLPVPATYVIDSDGVIRAAHVDKDYTRRMEPSDIIAALKGL